MHPLAVMGTAAANEDLRSDVVEFLCQEETQLPSGSYQDVFIK